MLVCFALSNTFNMYLMTGISYSRVFISSDECQSTMARNICICRMVSSKQVKNRRAPHHWVGQASPVGYTLIFLLLSLISITCWLLWIGLRFNDVIILLLNIVCKLYLVFYSYVFMFLILSFKWWQWNRCVGYLFEEAVSGRHHNIRLWWSGDWR